MESWNHHESLKSSRTREKHKTVLPGAPQSLEVSSDYILHKRSFVKVTFPDQACRQSGRCLQLWVWRQSLPVVLSDATCHKFLQEGITNITAKMSYSSAEEWGWKCNRGTEYITTFCLINDCWFFFWNIQKEEYIPKNYLCFSLILSPESRGSRKCHDFLYLLLC